jgi:SulP family sulfate permease
VIQFTLGAVKLGTIVNFVSHPVILGFMNAAAVIIFLSQLDMLLGIPKGRSDSFLYDIWEMFGYLPQTHLPTLAMSIFALALMLGLKKIPALSKLSVLIAVVVTIIVSALSISSTRPGRARAHCRCRPPKPLVTAYADADKLRPGEERARSPRWPRRRVRRKRPMTRGWWPICNTRSTCSSWISPPWKRRTRRACTTFASSSSNAPRRTKRPPPRCTCRRGADRRGNRWPPLAHQEDRERESQTGGRRRRCRQVIPSGLPSFRLPPLSLDAILSLLSAAFIIALVAFMESISMAKALAAQTKQRLDPNQELIGQGLANIGGGFFQAYPACGSFTGSAINLQAGAKTGFAMVFNGLFVAVTLLFLTDYLYHLPKATLAVIILLAVTSLITPKALKHTWQASKFDGIVAGVTFVITLVPRPTWTRAS